jgi:uncharacterized protein YbjT (DUF2867 family)
MILVTGATGNVGRELTTALVNRGAPVRALIRKPEDAEQFPTEVDVARGDLGAPDSLDALLHGIRKVFLLGGFSTMRDVLERLQRAGVEHIVLLTSRCVVGGQADNAITGMWLESERAVEGSGIPWTVLRPSGFHSNALRWLPQLVRGDVVEAPWPNVRIASIDPADIAAVAATVLTEPNHEETALSLSGPQSLTPGEQVGILGQVLRRPLRFVALDDDVARARMAVDTPAAFVDALFRFFSDGEFDDAAVVDTVAQVTGHGSRSFLQWVEAHTGAFASVATGHVVGVRESARRAAGAD